MERAIACRFAAGLSQTELAARVGVSRELIHAFESGKRDFDSMRFGVFRRWARALGLTFQQFSSGDHGKGRY